MRSVPFLAALACVVASATALAAPPLVLSHHGRLLSSDDTPVSASLNLRFAFYGVPEDVSGQPPSPAKWSVTYTNVEVEKGAYAVEIGNPAIGDAIPADLFAQNPSLWLGVKVGEGAELRPRMRVSSVPYAILAGTAELAKGLSCTGCVADEALSENVALLTGAQVFAGAKTFTSTAAFQPASGSVPFTVSASANGLVANLNAEAVGGQKLSDLDQRYAPAAGGTGYVSLQTGDAQAQAGGIAISGALAASGVTAATVTASGAVKAGSLDSAGLVKAGSVETSGAVSAGSVSTASVTAGSVSATNGLRIPVAGSAPTCDAGAVYLNSTDGLLYYCHASTWKKVGTRPAALDVTPPLVDFGVITGLSVDRTITVTNQGNEEATGLTLAVAGNGFTQKATTCTTALAAGASCTATVTLNPGGSFTGEWAGGFTVVSTAGGAHAVSLKGAVPASCAALKLAQPSNTTSTLYWVNGGIPGGKAFQVFCDMTRDGGGWSLVMQNNGGLTSPDPAWNEAINEVTITGSYGPTLTAFDVMVGLKYWNLFGKQVRIEMGASPTAISHRAFYDIAFNPSNNYSYSLSNENITVTATGTAAPGFKSGHQNRGFSTKDRNNADANCYASYGYAWWYTSCWDGSMWGSRNGGHQDKAFWASSNNEYFEYGAIWMK